MKKLVISRLIPDDMPVLIYDLSGYLKVPSCSEKYVQNCLEAPHFLVTLLGMVPDRHYFQVSSHVMMKTPKSGECKDFCVFQPIEGIKFDKQIQKTYCVRITLMIIYLLFTSIVMIKGRIDPSNRANIEQRKDDKSLGGH
jgi:hypothetical protein